MIQTAYAPSSTAKKPSRVARKPDWDGIQWQEPWPGGSPPAKASSQHQQRQQHRHRRSRHQQKEKGAQDDISGAGTKDRKPAPTTSEAKGDTRSKTREEASAVRKGAAQTHISRSQQHQRSPSRCQGEQCEEGGAKK